mmetsp:Transcript_17836/g.32226  ORF Transcript_17836/g.32226 Transcript_17836/m.32226 type:complete len:121 (-) Transcript_17836:309-671(-)
MLSVLGQCKFNPLFHKSKMKWMNQHSVYSRQIGGTRCIEFYTSFASAPLAVLFHQPGMSTSSENAFCEMSGATNFWLKDSDGFPTLDTGNGKPPVLSRPKTAPCPIVLPSNRSSGPDRHR